MHRPKFSIVVTSINQGDFLEGYCAQAEAEGVKDDLKIIVIPDLKSPPALYQKCTEFIKLGFDITCPAFSEQDSFLQRLGHNLPNLIPYNTDNRRNVGFLMALESGCDVLISLDDDNYCIPGTEVFKPFASVLQDELNLSTVHSSNGWFNICDLVTTEPGYPVYPRGFPYHKRHQAVQVSQTVEPVTVRMNAGLWLGEPDIDALSWLAAPVTAVGFKGQAVVLGSDAWSPVNTQNTSLHRDLISAYYYIRMGYTLAGFPIDRMGDIFSGYLCQACAQHMGHSVLVGPPIAQHKRNSHNYLQDLSKEMAGILILEDFLEWLPGVKLSGANYGETYLSLASAIDDQTERFSGSIWTDPVRGFLHQMAYHMRKWVQVCQIIQG